MSLQHSFLQLSRIKSSQVENLIFLYNSKLSHYVRAYLHRASKQMFLLSSNESLKLMLVNIYCLPTKLQEGNVFSHVCQSVILSTGACPM